MNQQCKHIIFCPKRRHIVCEAAGIDWYGFAGDHAQYVVFQAIEVEINIDLQCFKCFRLIPVIFDFAEAHAVYDRSRAVNRRHLFERISVVPIFDFFQIHLILFAELFHFRFRKPYIFRQRSRADHGEFIKHV